MMPEHYTSDEHQKHLYLVFDDWKSGYSIREVSLSARSGKQPLPVFMRVSALRGFPEFFTSAFGTKILAMHPRSRVGDVCIGVPTIDVVDRTCTYELEPNIVGAPIYFPVSDDMVFTLDIATFEILRTKPERVGQPWARQKLTHPPFRVWDVSAYGVHPDGFILVSTKKGTTFIFDTKKCEWKPYGHWVFPFTGRGHYDSSLKGFVGLSKDPETHGYLYCCIMASTVTGDTDKVLLPTSPDLKCTNDTVYSKNPAEGQHVSATLVHLSPGKFCLVECVLIHDDGVADMERADREFNMAQPGAHHIECRGGRPQGGRFMYRLKTFSLSDMEGVLKLGHCKVCCYSLPHEARMGTILRDPVAFWL